jgi:hypothetical protein
MFLQLTSKMVQKVTSDNWEKNTDIFCSTSQQLRGMCYVKVFELLQNSSQTQHFLVQPLLSSLALFMVQVYVSQPSICNTWNFWNVIIQSLELGSSVSMTTMDLAIRVWSQTEVEDSSFTLCAQPALGPTQPPVQWVPRVLSPGVKCSQGVSWPLTPL